MAPSASAFDLIENLAQRGENRTLETLVPASGTPREKHSTEICIFLSLRETNALSGQVPDWYLITPALRPPPALSARVPTASMNAKADQTSGPNLRPTPRP